MRSLLFFLGTLLVVQSTQLLASSKGGVVWEIVSALTKKVSGESAEGISKATTKELAERINQVLLKTGDDGASALRQIGPDALRAIEQANGLEKEAAGLLVKFGRDSLPLLEQPRLLVLVSQLGDDAAGAIIKHPVIAESTLKACGLAGAKALKSIDAQNARRLAMMLDDEKYRGIISDSRVLGVIAKYGDSAMDFIWRNKGALIVSATLAAFLVDPESFIRGTMQLGMESESHPSLGRSSNNLVQSVFQRGLGLLLFCFVVWRVIRMRSHCTAPETIEWVILKFVFRHFVRLMGGRKGGSRKNPVSSINEQQ